MGTIILALLALRFEAGPVSTYAPHDGHNAGELACGGPYRMTDVHLAHRHWNALGCNRRVIVCTRAGRCALLRVRDGGPYGTVDTAGRWALHVGLEPPQGRRFRGLVDLSHAAWTLLGRPPFLSPIVLIVLAPDPSVRHRKKHRDVSST